MVHCSCRFGLGLIIALMAFVLLLPTSQAAGFGGFLASEDDTIYIEDYFAIIWSLSFIFFVTSVLLLSQEPRKRREGVYRNRILSQLFIILLLVSIFLMLNSVAFAARSPGSLSERYRTGDMAEEELLYGEIDNEVNISVVGDTYYFYTFKGGDLTISSINGDLGDEGDWVLIKVEEDQGKIEARQVIATRIYTFPAALMAISCIIVLGVIWSRPEMDYFVQEAVFSTASSQSDPVQHSSTPASTVGSVAAPASTVGGVAAPASTVGGVVTPTSTVGGVGTPASTVGSVAAPGSTVGGVAAPASTVGGVETPASTVGGVETPASTVGGVGTPASSVEKSVFTASGSRVQAQSGSQMIDVTCLRCGNTFKASGRSAHCPNCNMLNVIRND